MRTHCKAGHELSGKNAIIRTDSNSVRCRLCQKVYGRIWRDANRSLVKQKSVTWSLANPGGHRLYAHRLTRESFDAIIRTQHNCCASCGRLFGTDGNSRPEVDHDHLKGCHPGHGSSCEKCRREIICGRCNRLIGMANENPENFIGPIQYLDRHRKKTDA